jgi:hypothetical protein
MYRVELFESKHQQPNALWIWRWTTIDQRYDGTQMTAASTTTTRQSCVGGTVPLWISLPVQYHCRSLCPPPKRNNIINHQSNVVNNQPETSHHQQQSTEDTVVAKTAFVEKPASQPMRRRTIVDGGWRPRTIVDPFFFDRPSFKIKGHSFRSILNL